MHKLPLPLHLRRRPVCSGMLGATILLGSFAATSTLQAAAPAANASPAKRALQLAAACNPCAAKRGCNPCNPCAAKRACNPCNPCAASVSAGQFTRPCGAAVRPGADPALVTRGKRLWNDPSLGNSGLSCSSCHAGNASLNPGFAKPYPHPVQMPKQMAGVEQVHADEMVQFCMVVPMQAKPLPWGSRDLAALTAYTLEVQKSFNPCAAKKRASPCNPCAPKRGACNPCAAKKRSG